jgi:hypothetical protein
MINGFPPTPNNADVIAFIAANGPVVSGGYQYDIKYALQASLGLTDAQGLQICIDDMWARYLTEIKGTTRTNLTPGSDNMAGASSWFLTGGTAKSEQALSSAYGPGPYGEKNPNVQFLTDNSGVQNGANTRGSITVTTATNYVMSLFVLPLASNSTTIGWTMSFSGGAGGDVTTTANPTDDENSIQLPVSRHGPWKRYAFTSASGSNTALALSVHPAYNADGGLSADVAAQGTQLFYGIQIEEGTLPTKYIQNTTAGSSVSVMDRFQNPLNNASFTLD